MSARNGGALPAIILVGLVWLASASEVDPIVQPSVLDSAGDVDTAEGCGYMSSKKKAMGDDGSLLEMVSWKVKRCWASGVAARIASVIDPF